MTKVAAHGQHIYYRDVHQPLPRPDDVDESGAIAVARAHRNDGTPGRFAFPHIEPAAGPAEASGPDIAAGAIGPGSQALDVTDRMRLLGFWHTLRPDLPAM
jgi:hypothetical protein